VNKSVTMQILVAVIMSFIILPSVNAEFLSNEEYLGSTKKNRMSEHFNRATRLYNEGKNEEAIKEWEKVLKIDPDHQLSKDKIKNAKRKENIAVFDFKALNVSAADAAAITDFIRTSLVNTGKYTVLERGSMDKILAEQGFQQTGCTTEDCAIQMGKILNIQKAIIGSYSKVSGLDFITASVIDMKTSKITISKRVKFGDIDDIDSVIDNLVSLIIGDEQSVKEIDDIDEKIRKMEQGIFKNEKPNFGIGLHNLGGSLRYFAGITTLEAKGVFGDGFNAFGPRLYINLNPKSNAVIYIGGEYSLISGESELQKFTGTASGAFIGLELFISNKFSFLLDIGSYAIALDSEFDNIGVSDNYNVGNIGVNLYF